ncbi:MAG: DNA topoisomerase, partial [Lentisphaerae bacterium]|nr:DNA topoisomerase [Lentisphaerota bacterium]
EANGIGRPSTYATIVNTIQQRKYVDKLKGKLIPTVLGFKVNDFLVANLGNLFQISFTAEMELKLDKVEEGEIQWQAMLEEFYKSFSTWVGEAKTLGSPEKEKAEKAVHLFDTVQNWKAPEKKARRTYDDHKFVESVKGQFEKNGGISEKQWGAILRLAFQYKDQIPGYSLKMTDLGVDPEAPQASAGSKAQGEAAADPRTQAEKAAEMEIFKELLSLLQSVKTADPETERRRGGRKFDDKKFIASIKNQLDDGRILSEKQINAIKKLTVKYKEQIPDFEKLSPKLNLTENASAAGTKGTPASSANAEEIQKLIDQLAGITEWEKPVKKGFRTFDDKAFYGSLSKQFAAKKNLSEKQLAALKKIVGKYIKQ